MAGMVESGDSPKGAAIPKAASEGVSQNKDEWVVACFDNLHPRDMTFPVGMQAEALAATMTRHEKPCPLCGCTTWIALGSIDEAVAGEKARVIASVQG